MKQKLSSRRKRSTNRSVLRLPDLEHAKAAVLNSLSSTDAKRGYRHAIEEFVTWFDDKPRARAWAFMALSGSWADHYGMAAMYLRLNGLVPPTAKQEEKK
jgi:hypothetical protein